ncbi:glycosyltransferase [Azospirillum agricola]|uniref:glycosyltransferase n=1 Tax=Azospirillum agricola TaxID=1720247 RepID=UPI000A0F007F|nr:glycosyltransferase [Azospirillum agricola]SMH41559.1 hypothetical protein SAMN02982994_1740 [Azospirillum lipoferum]
MTLAAEPAGGAFAKHPRFLELTSLRRRDPDAVAQTVIAAALRQPETLLPLARLCAALDGRGMPPPFDDPAWNAGPEPERTVSGKKETSRRSVVFLGNSYYNFLYLAAALRRRGWDALSVNLEDDTDNGLLFHGEDLNLRLPDGREFLRNLRSFYDVAARRFRMIHLYGKGRLAFFPENSGVMGVPWDLLALKARGLRIGYSTYGCQDSVSQSSFDRWSGGHCCSVCVSRDQLAVCSDAGNLAWGRRVQALCDLISIEIDAMLDFKAGPQVYREPLTCALDPELWRPDLPIPDHFRRLKDPDEVIIYHAVGDYDLRTRDGRNLKGTHAIVNAVEALQRKGLKVRLDFVKGVPSREIRFAQAQADIVVDQILYGRHGANGREAMMLGKPTVVHMNASEDRPDGMSDYVRNCPTVQADASTLETVLEDLVRAPEKRRKLGAASRDYALKWWSADACAERYETVYDRIMAGQAPSERAGP